MHHLELGKAVFRTNGDIEGWRLFSSYATNGERAV